MTEHWANDEEQRSHFWTTTEGWGLDASTVKGFLGVSDLRNFTGSIGDALNTVLAAKAAHDKNRAKQAAEVPSGELYADEKTKLLAEAIARVAPWAHNENYPLDAADIALAVQRCVGMGLDPLNPHEVQIWKDRHGLHFQLAFTLLHQWATQILGGHTEPRYTQLDEPELTAEGLNVTDIAYLCRFVMKEDIPLIRTMAESGWDPLEARQEMTLCGLGTCTKADWDQKWFAPNARSKAWKVRKRAYTDAIRTRFGTPGRGSIEEMRRLRGEDHITATDWQVGPGTAGERVRLAALTATGREREPDDREPEEVLAEGRAILHGEEVVI